MDMDGERTLEDAGDRHPMGGVPGFELPEALMIGGAGDDVDSGADSGDDLGSGDSMSVLPEVLIAAKAVGVDDEKSGSESDPTEKAESIDSPAKVMRIGTMLKRLLKQARSIDLDEASRQRLRDVYETSVTEIGSALSSDLSEELNRLTSPFGHRETPPSAAELQIAKAQLVGWLEGLIRGMQAMLFAQEMAARRQLEALQAELMPGSSTDVGSQRSHEDGRPSAYL